MTWVHTIERNKKALLQILAALVSCCGLKLDRANQTMPYHQYRKAIWTLRAAESAARRLVVIVAACLAPIEFKPRKRANLSQKNKPRSRVSQLAQAQKEEGQAVCSDADHQLEPKTPKLPLIDQRKRFGLWTNGRKKFKPIAEHKMPRLCVIGYFEPKRPKPPAPKPPILPDDRVDATPIIKRIKSIIDALDHLPREAKRLQREIARRELLPPGPNKGGAMRPGYAPGLRLRPREDIEFVLQKCHDHAWYAERWPPPPELIDLL